MAQSSLVPVQFNGATLVTTLIDGVPYVALRPICESIGVDWKAQYNRIKRHPVLSTCVVVMTTQMPGDDQAREVFMLPLDKLNGWLFGVSVSRVKPELRDRLTVYQTECFGALAKHFGATELSSKTGQLPNALRQITPPAPTEPPAIDVRTLLLSGQSEPQPLAAEHQALVDARAWQLAGEAYQLAREHIVRAIAFQSFGSERSDPKNPQIASIVKGITLNAALAHAYWSELRSLRSAAETAIYIAKRNLEHLNAALAGQPKPKDMLY